MKGRGWNDGKILEPKNERKNGHVHENTYKSTARQIDALSGTLKNRQNGGQTDRQTGSQTDGQTGRQPDRQAGKQRKINCNRTK